ncbi:MAG: 3'-5' exonuclease, partial [Porticoccaceae bacterium]
FRSQAGVVGWVNRLFASAFPAIADASRGAVPYASSSAVKAELAGPAVAIDLFRGPPDSIAEAEAVADCVIAARADNPTGTIAILVRGRAHLREILPALRRRGLQWQATDIDPLGTRMPVIDLLSLTRALLCPADRIPWLAVLRAPWCGLNLADLHALANHATEQPPDAGDRYPLLLTQILHHRDIAGLSNAGRQILARAGAVFATAWHERQRKPLRTWVEGIWIALGGPAALVDPGALTDCRQYLDLLERHADTGMINDWPAFVAAVDRLYAAPAPDADPRLQIMTIHKAKGLEFDTVILPSLHRAGRNDAAELLLWAERVSAAGQAELLIAAPHKLGEADDPLYSYLKREGAIKTRLENTRVLYVACTRAVRRLHLLFHEPPKQAARNSLLAPLWPALVEELATPPADTAVRIHQNPVIATAESATDIADVDEDNDTIDAQQLPTHSLRLPAGWQYPALAAPPPTGDLRSAARGIADSRRDIDAQSDRQQDARHQDARHIGTVLHRALRQVVLDTVARWDGARIARQKPAWAIQLRELGVADIESALARIKAALIRCLDHPEGQWLLNHEHPDSACELALGYLINNNVATEVADDAASDGRQRTAIIDRTFVAEGTRWIIDYKSATPVAGEPQAAFLARQREQYREQLAGYARLFSGTDKPPVRVALYYPLLPHLDVVDLNTDAG